MSRATRLRSAPFLDSEVVAVLAFEVVRHEWREDGSIPEGWTPVRLANEVLAYVRSRCVRSPIDYRAIFSKRDGRWRMRTLIAGD